ncbi:hypothetical protein [Asticcacaulis sp. EMRT-3]|uniref:hypothetical protein n=1 Tax=Asticcacaulis sp. EMRT-3 TaxID=3040349 RepID=UPI0024AF335F|nr:hypothetical protein [Asticcacaulis sp. EMRT-3]MDI7776404.1 hypothetical protein [Asticcacaulis sp. EMRT-3]
MKQVRFSICVALALMLSSLSGCGTAGQDVTPPVYKDGILQPSPEIDHGNYGRLRHGSKFGLTIGMPEAEVGSILLAQKGEFQAKFSCIDPILGNHCKPGEPDRTLQYAIHQHTLLIAPAGIIVDVLIKDGKISEIAWGNFWGDGW